MTRLSIVLDALKIAEKHLAYVEINEAIAIVKQMMRTEPIARSLHDAIGTVLEGWTLPDGVRKTLETAYYAEPQAIITTNRCNEKGKVGGCQLHNLQCSYPACKKDMV
jgi:hypothetical protein